MAVGSFKNILGLQANQTLKCHEQPLKHVAFEPIQTLQFVSQPLVGAHLRYKLFGVFGSILAFKNAIVLESTEDSENFIACIDLVFCQLGIGRSEILNSSSVLGFVDQVFFVQAIGMELDRVCLGVI